MPLLHHDNSIELNDIIKNCWDELTLAARSSTHPYHFPVLATNHQNEVELRTVVLRAVIQNEESLVFYSDFRSPKINQIQENPQVSWLFYSGESRIQIRIKGLAKIHHQDEISHQYWKLLKSRNKRDYATILSPSSTINNNKEVDYIKDGNDEQLFDHFVGVTTEVTEIDWLRIGSDSNKRARFLKEKSGFMGEWLVP
nr:pyridoxamine 5'-phosphate oxidase family protein [Pseudopedobacter sp.]